MLAFLSLLITLLCFAQQGLSLAHSKAHHHRRGGLTNGERFARGLPPAPPKRYFGSRSETARRSSVSAVPGQTVIGTLSFVDGSTTYYVTDNGGVSPSSSNAIKYQYIDPASSATTVQLQELNSANVPQDAWLGFGSFDAAQLDITTYVQILTAYSPTGSGSSPTESDVNLTNSAYVETMIFAIDPTTGDVTVSWVNPDATSAVEVILSTDGSTLYMGSGTNYASVNSFTQVNTLTFTQS